MGVAIVFLIGSLCSLALSIDKYHCRLEEKRKKKEEREKTNARNEVTAEEILDTLRKMENGFAMNPSLPPSPPLTHVFVELRPDSDILVCKYCGKEDPDLNKPCVPIDKDPDCDMKYMGVYMRSGRNFFCFAHQWHSDNGKGCESPFKIRKAA